MTATKNGTSRASSARPGSVARTIAKRRDKPYKTEQSRVLARKRKLDLHTTYTNPPPGFQFLPVGTPDLADRCKELSRQRGLPVNVVNAKPVSRMAVDPARVSHHIHRIGYHFRSEVVDDACQQLGYTLNYGKFVKEDDMNEMNERGKMALALAKHGIKIDQPRRQQETDEQVRAAIKELFPRIPEEDLQAIVMHAWEEGSRRVGTHTDMELPRKVQLATIARIRHTYTDYDRLLRAFEWKDARTLVEPACLAKLIEWRGENEEEDDDELEEIVRETIVIDDDDNEAPQNGSEADDEDSVVEDGGYTSDTSVEISHRPAVDADLGAESNDERSRRFLNRYQQPPPPPLRISQRHHDIRQKIGVVQQQRRDGIALEYARQPEVVRVHVPESGNGLVEINGQLYRREPALASMPRTHSQPLSTPRVQPVGAYGDQHGYSPQSRMSLPSSRPTNPAEPLHDRPIASIEPHEDLRRMAITSAKPQHGEPYRSAGYSRPVTPDSEHSGKRRRVDYSSQSMDDRVRRPRQDPSISSGGRPLISYGVAREVVDLSSTRRPVVPYNGSSEVVDLTDSPPRRRVVYPNPALDHISIFSHGHPPKAQDSYGYAYKPGPADTAYDPQHPLLPANYRNGIFTTDTHRREQDHRRGFVDNQVAPIQYVPLSQPSSSSLHSRGNTMYQNGTVSYTGQQHPPGVFAQSQRPSQTPQPVHGAPAVVQQVPRERGYPPPASQIPPVSGPVPPASGVQIRQFPALAPPLQILPQPQYHQTH